MISCTLCVAKCLVLVKISLSRHSTFMLQQSLVKARIFYVATEFGLGQGFYVAIKCFYAAIEFGQDQ